MWIIIRYKIFIIILLCGFGSYAQPRPKMTVEEYVDMYKAFAVEEMLDHGIPASITLAQGILESNCGNSPLAIQANNHFGIKCHKEWTGKTFYQDDDEKNECFRSYPKAEDSYRDHSDFLVTRDRYNALFGLEITDYRGWAHGLKQAGYATNPKYPELLVKIIEENGLDVFDRMPVSGKHLATGETNDPKTRINKHSEPDNADFRLKADNSKLTTGPPDVFDFVETGGNGRMIFENNGVKFVYAREGDDIWLLADEFGIYSWQILAYNELEREDKLKAGQKVYLLKKKRKAEYDYHLVRAGEDLRGISQDYGIRMGALCRMNRIKKGDKIREGDVLILK